MKMKRRQKRKCPICETELDEDEDVCHICGACQDEPCYDIEDDLDE